MQMRDLLAIAVFLVNLQAAKTIAAGEAKSLRRPNCRQKWHIFGISYWNAKVCISSLANKQDDIYMY